MCSMKKIIILCQLLFITALLFGYFVVGSAKAQDLYSYFDDFSTDKAMVDSYSHSTFVDTLPPIHLAGHLMYSFYPPGNRTLGFYEGFMIGGEAYLKYKFPLNGGTISITEGLLEFDVYPAENYPIMELILYVSYAGSSESFSDSILVPGHYLYVLSPADSCDGVFVDFVGGDLLLDNLWFSLHFVNPIERSTWSLIKTLFH